MIYQADWLLTLDGPPLPGGWIRVEGDCIAETGPGTSLPPDQPLQKFPGCVLLPGFINAHCHLELTSLRGKLDPGPPFPDWVAALRRITANYSPQDYREAARQGIAELLRGGTTTVVDVGNSGEAPALLAQSPLRGFGFVEVLGLDPDLAHERLQKALAKIASVPQSPGLKPGLAPHSAYACSPAMLGGIRGHQRDRGLPWTLHAAESREEWELFAAGSGPLQEFCQSIYAGAPIHVGTTPVGHLENNGLLPDGALIVHGNHLSAEDFPILRKRMATVVHCPSSHAFFGHAAFPFAALREHGIPVCLGTDSLASGDSLSMLDQIRMFRAHFPDVSAETALRMATQVAAAAVGLGNRIGRMKEGFQADAIAIKMPPGTAGDPVKAVLEPGSEVIGSLLNGVEAVL